uniref:Secreted protein n=1 Tax=Mesocestoides corti TaxID=53468 RepID=A0A5K3EQH4_MESCO
MIRDMPSLLLLPFLLACLSTHRLCEGYSPRIWILFIRFHSQTMFCPSATKELYS